MYHDVIQYSMGSLCHISEAVFPGGAFADAGKMSRANL
jgi:hypothetical protein